jgi:hypothetical protein
LFQWHASNITIITVLYPYEIKFYITVTMFISP